MVFNLLFPLWFVITLFADFGAANNTKIRALALVFAVRLQIFAIYAKYKYGLEMRIESGRRTAAEQDALHRQDSRNPPATSGSSHMIGNAADLNFLRNGVAVLLKGSPAASWQPLYELAADCGIKNGSLFTGYPDRNHFFIS